MDYQFGAEVRRADGQPVGELRRIVIDPDTGEATMLVITHNEWDGRQIMVPLESVRTADSEGVDLLSDADTFDQFEDYSETVNLAPPPDAAHVGSDTVDEPDVPDIPPIGAATGVESIAFTPIVQETVFVPVGTIAIGPETVVWATDHELGRLKQLRLSEQTGRVDELLVEHGLIFKHETVVAAGLVERWLPETIVLSVTGDALPRLMVAVSSFDLDNRAAYAVADPADMYTRLEKFPEQLRSGWRLGMESAIPAGLASVRNVLLVGMGGSAIGASLLSSYSVGQMPVPLTVWRGYGVPGWVGAETLVIVVSFSGGTEETVSALQAAQSRGSHIVALTGGGQVAERTEAAGGTLLRFEYEAQPRAALGYLFAPLLALFTRLGWLADHENTFAAAVRAVDHEVAVGGVDQPAATNRAKQIAQALHGRLPVIYGAEYLGEVAHRWKTQLNENAKSWAAYEEFSELNHNAVVGYEFPSEITSRTKVLLLHGAHLSPRIARRMDVTEELLHQYGVGFQRVESSKGDRLAEMLSLIALGDFVSYYLALLNGADPTVIPPIDLLKQRLAESR